MNNPFWAFSLAHYALDDVPEACLALQDGFGLDVNVLLYAAWLAEMDRCVTPEHLEALEAIIGPWRTRVVQPLRALRRQWRNYPQASGIRNQIKTLELDSERQQQDMMLAHYQSVEALPLAVCPLEENLSVVARFFCGDKGDWSPAALRLVVALGHAVRG
jgi:uncharacterized protein (TIGR02444 family)